MKVVLVTMAVATLLGFAGAAAAQVNYGLGTRAAEVPSFIGDGLTGSIWTSYAPNIAGSRAITSIGSAAVSFAARAMDYPQGADFVDSGSPLNDFLGTDAASLIGLDGATENSSGKVFTFTGFIAIRGPGTYRFTVASDDGMELLIGGQRVTAFDGDRGFDPTSGSGDFAESGLYTIDLLYWANDNGESGMAFSWLRPGDLDPAIVSSADLYTIIPTPSAAALLALGGLMAARRRR